MFSNSLFLFQNNVNRDQFVQDPALLRERAEARRAAIQQRKGWIQNSICTLSSVFVNSMLTRWQRKITFSSRCTASCDKTFSFLSSSFRPERPSNVVGKPKGQGQTLETILDRRKKEANKSRVSNHNRRTMADRKRNKGMIPTWAEQNESACCWKQKDDV